MQSAGTRCGLETSSWGYAGFGLCFHTPRCHFGLPFLEPQPTFQQGGSSIAVRAAEALPPDQRRPQHCGPRIQRQHLQVGNLQVLLLDARLKMLGMQQPWRNTGCRLATCRCCCWMRGPKCWGCNRLGATQAAGWQPAGVAAGCEAQNAGDATALAQHRLQVGNLQVLLLDARLKMLGMQQPWRNTGCRLATCRCCCWMRGPKCWGCNSLGATQAAGWQPAGVAAGCEAQNAGDATALAQHRLQVGNLQVLLLDARPKMLGMQQPWRNTGCRLATCRCCCWMRGPKCWGCNSLGATQAAGWQPAGVAAGCEAQNAGDATALAQHSCRLATCRCCCKMPGMQQPWRNTGCRLAICRWLLARPAKCQNAGGWQHLQVAAFQASHATSHNPWISARVLGLRLHCES